MVQHSNSPIFPAQKLPKSKKTQEWKESCVNSIIAREGTSSVIGSRTRKERMLINYELYNGNFNEDDLKHVTNPFKVDDGFPATPQNMNIVRPKIDLLLGEESKRPFNILVVQSNDDVVSDIVSRRIKMLKEYVMSRLNSELTGEFSEEEINPEQIDKYFKEDFKTIGERSASDILNYYREKLHLTNEFVKGFKDGLIAGEEIYYTGIVNGEPILERVNPRNCDFDKNIDTELIEDGDWFLFSTKMSPAAIYDRFYDIMTEAQLDSILELIEGRGFSKQGGNTGSKVNTKTVMYKDNISSKFLYGEEYGQYALQVWHAVWRSFKKVGFVTSYEQEEEMVNMVEEGYKEGPGEEIEWDWIVETWEGYRIGGTSANSDGIYVGVNPIEYQHVSVDNPNSQKLPYSGVLYSDTNSRGKSLVGVMKPLQYMYIVIWYRLELALARDKGKIINMDITQIPKSMGIDIERWMHILSSLGVNFINPYECFAPGTKVMMADGTVRNIEDIQLGDLVMGPDGLPRNVLETHSGVDHMYRLKSITGCEDQVINSKHKIYYKQRNYFKGLDEEKFDNPLELLKEDFEKPHVKNIRYLERAEDVDLNWSSNLLLDPYLLGLYLGDGSTGKVEITNIDPEVIFYLEGYAEENDMDLSITKAKEFSDVMILRLFKGRNNKPNPFKESLKYYDVLNNKHIPKDFIYTSRENRLKLLAGLIDTDGYYSKRDNYYVFSQSENRKHIVEDAAFIARSLGFKCTVSKYDGLKEKYICDSTKLSICQPTHVLRILNWNKEIPVKIERKKASLSNKNGRRNQSNFKVNYEGIGEFYGITIDEDNLFLLNDFTIVHNSEWGNDERSGGKAAPMNQMGALDLSMSNVIAGYIELMSKIEDMIGEISGVSRQRQGSIQQRELVGNVERSVIQSSHITEPLFWSHNLAKKHAITNFLNVAKHAIEQYDKKYIHYFTDDLTRNFFEVADDFIYSDFDIFVSDSTRDFRNLEVLRNLIQPAMQNGASLLDAANILTTENVSEVKSRLEDIETKRKEREDELARIQQEGQQQAAQMAAEIEGEKIRIAEEDSIRDSQTAIEVALINAESKEGDGEIEVEDDSLERDKLELQSDRQKEEATIKRRQLQETIRSNKVNEEIKRKAANKRPTSTSK